RQKLAVVKLCERELPAAKQFPEGHASLLCAVDKLNYFGGIGAGARNRILRDCTGRKQREVGHLDLRHHIIQRMGVQHGALNSLGDIVRSCDKGLRIERLHVNIDRRAGSAAVCAVYVHSLVDRIRQLKKLERRQGFLPAPKQMGNAGNQGADAAEAGQTARKHPRQSISGRKFLTEITQVEAAATRSWVERLGTGWLSKSQACGGFKSRDAGARASRKSSGRKFCQATCKCVVMFPSCHSILLRSSLQIQFLSATHLQVARSLLRFAPACSRYPCIRSASKSGTLR